MFKKTVGSAAATALLFAGLTGLALAQTATTSRTASTSSTTTGNTTTGATTGTTVPTVTPTTPAVTVPGAPNTGAGGDAAMNLAILGTSALAAVAGAAYVARRLAKR